MPSHKEQLFCYFLSILGNPSESASRAGYDNPHLSAQKLLSRSDILNLISSNSAPLDTPLLSRVRCGYERLAFGSVADPISLLLSDNPASLPLDKLDLFSISEIKYPKTGGLEIKFFDRSKALEKLLELAISHSSNNTADDLISALQNLSSPDQEVLDNEI